MVSSDDMREDGPSGGAMMSDRDGAAGAPLQFPCKSCGATLVYSPGAEALSCGYCGYLEPIPRGDAPIAEHDIESFGPSGRAQGWGVERVEYRCDACGANTSVEPHQTAFRCAFCGSTKVVRREEVTEQERPESLVPFQVTGEQAAEAFRAWIQSLWFRPTALKKLAQPGELSGVYLPVWTYDALTHSRWTAESGTYYYTTETYRDANGRTQTRQVRHVAWRWVSGEHDAFFDDVQEPGSPSVARELMLRIQPFDTTRLLPYKPDYLAGFAAEDYREDVRTCWPRAAAQMDEVIRAAITARIPGDTHRNLSVQTSYHNRTYKLALLPVWAGAYQYGGKAYSYIVNGQSARVAGTTPWSWIKITAAVLSAIGIGFGVYALVQ